MESRWDKLISWCEQPGKKLLAFDFDGTLAPNVTSPTDPTGLPPNIREKLEKLTQHRNVQVAVISGRGFPTLYDLVGFRNNIIFVGNHGLELHSDTFDYVHPEAKHLTTELENCLLKLKKALNHIPHLEVEEKTFSGAVFFKNTPVEFHDEVVAITEPILEKYVNLHFLKTFGVYEVCMNINWHKGSSALFIANHCRIDPHNIFFAGDEINDEPALKDVRAGQGISLKVGHQASVAEYRIREQSLMGKVLQIFLDHIR